MARKEKENSHNEQYIESNPLVLPEANLPLTLSHVFLCKNLTRALVWEFLLISKYKTFKLQNPFNSVCVHVPALSD